MKKIPSWQFGDTKKEADYLQGLVISGKKTATSSLYESYLDKKMPLPKVGDKNVILDSKGRKRCSIITTKASHKPFSKVSAAFAFKEGEGDRSLAYWRKAHKKFFEKRLEKMKRKFDENTLIVCEEFKVLKIFDLQ